MSSKKITPPPMRKSVLLKIKLKNLAAKLKPILKNAIALSLIMGSLGYLLLKGPELHGLYLRTTVGSKVYKIQGKLGGGGGTGFAVKAPSGIDYIVTNSHVCEGALSQSEDKTSLLVVNEDGAMRRKIIENSDFTDLCLLEGLPGVEGLSVGSEPSIGQVIAAVGHPRLRPLSISRGEVVGRTDVQIVAYVMKSGDERLDAVLGAEDGKCDLPKNKIEEVDHWLFGHVKLCTNVTKDTIMSTVVIFPGNSGSPIVDFWGNVTGVAFASDGTNWALIVSNKDLKQFLRRY
jgi:S1-C subfamily serine protease